MMLPGSNPRAEPPRPPADRPTAPPSTSLSMSSSEPGALPPPPGSDGEVSAGWGRRAAAEAAAPP